MQASPLEDLNFFDVGHHEGERTSGVTEFLDGPDSTQDLHFMQFSCVDLTAMSLGLKQELQRTTRQRASAVPVIATIIEPISAAFSFIRTA
ncbi:MAG: hypothetical protein OXR62_09755 [Ahrensia sp.]|nr:hypothetical protein [Ahrensia sp.]